MIITVKPEHYLIPRKGETRIGECLTFCSRKGWKSELKKAKKETRFCVIGIPECVGVLGNLGRPGTQNAWEAFLKYFCNVQSNRFLSGKEFMVLGAVDVEAIQDKAEALNPEYDYYLQKLHLLCEEIDDLVEAVIQEVKAAQLIPIVIGGGHNNAYPIIKACAATATKKKVNAINLDAHADFRALEGRHSGNGFSYGRQKKALNRYFAFGLHQSYNSENMLMSMDADEQVKYSFLENITYLESMLADAISFVVDDQIECGIEVDMDAIKMMPSSAISPTGFSLEQARLFIRKCTSSVKPAYLHLPESAPNSDEQKIIVGKALTYLVTDFAKEIIHSR
ncbi:MAG TPA: formimidoylglutamase [Roseivirga sp.]